MSRHFEIDKVDEFLAGGNVRYVHQDDIPIYIGFLIKQVADLRTLIGQLMTQAIDLHSMFQGDMTQIQNAFNQLVAVNTQNLATAQAQAAQIQQLQQQLATGGSPVTANDLQQLNSFASTIQQAAQSTVTAPPAAPTGQTSTVTTTPATGPAPTDTSTPPVDAAPAPSTPPAPVTGTPTTMSGSVPPLRVDTSDSGTSTST